MITTSVGVGRIARICAALAFSTLVAGQGPSFAQTKVIIGTAKDPNLGAQLIIARDKGYFREAGLDAERVGDVGAEVVDARLKLRVAFLEDGGGGGDQEGGKKVHSFLYIKGPVLIP